MVFLIAVAHRIVPGLGRENPELLARFREIVDGAMAARPAAIRAQFSLFLTLLRWLPALRFGAPLDRLPPRTQDRVLRWFQDGPILRLRQGLWAVKTLVCMGYYGQPEIAARIRYRPSFTGNRELGGADG